MNRMNDYLVREVEMSLEIYGLILLVGLFFAICVGFPISFTLITLGVVFGYIGLGERVFHLMTYSFFGTMMDTVLAAVALFTFMGYVLESAGLMERLFQAVQLLSGRLRGSLYMGTIFTATLFAAATGIVGASVTIIGLMAAPVMKKTGYDTGLSAGTICAGGTLGILIPPSVMLVVMGPVMQVSVARLYAAAILPGLLLAFLYIVYTTITGHAQTRAGPAPVRRGAQRSEEPTSCREFFVGLVPVASLILAHAGNHHLGTGHADGRGGPRLPRGGRGHRVQPQADLQDRQGIRLPDGRDDEHGDDPPGRLDVHGGGLFLDGDAQVHRRYAAGLESAALGVRGRHPDRLFHPRLAAGMGADRGRHHPDVPPDPQRPARST